MESLTKREEEILLYVVRGKSNTTIAKKLFISSSTAKAHVCSILRKMNAKNRIVVALKSHLYYEPDKIEKIVNEVDKEYEDEKYMF